MNGQQNDQQAPPELPAEMNGQQNDQQAPPELPAEMNGQQNDQQAPPELPADMNGQQNDQQAPPELPAEMNGQQNGMPGSMPGGMPGQQNGMPDGMPGQQNVTDYTAAQTVTESSSDTSYASTNDNENAVLVSGSEVSIDNATVTKSGSASGESADFYGINAALLATDGAVITVSDTTVSSDGTHANGIFSYGTGTSVSVSDTIVTTTGNNSGGLMTTGGASMTATNVTVTTSGNSSAAIRTDRGGGTVTAEGGSYTTSGVGSPAIYSTADITVSDATLSASKSEAVVIEGGNSVTLSNVTLTGSNSELNGQSTENTNVLIYQSMSGDASEGNSDFSMTGGSLTSETGSMFHVTNVTTTITLNDVTLTMAADSDVLVSATADSWGTSGSNGGHVTVNMTDQTASGNIVTDSISSVAVSLSDGSSYTGAINKADTGNASVVLDSTSTWTLTGDSYVDSFDGDLSQVNLNGYTLYVNGVAVSK